MKASQTLLSTPTVDTTTDLSIELPPRPWLEVDTEKMCLIYWDSERTRVSKPRTLDLKVVLPDGTDLLDGFNMGWLQLVLSYFYLVRDEPEKPVHSASVHHYTIQRLLTFLKWARLAGLFDLRRMTPKLAEKYSSEIALGTGHALRYADRLEAYIDSIEDNLPVIADKHFPKRKRLDVAKICEATFISPQALSADKAAYQLLARVSRQYGYYLQSKVKVTAGPLPAPTPLTRVTHSRHIDAMRLLHTWNKKLGGAGLSFVPCPMKTKQTRSGRLRATGHTKNLAPNDVMNLLDQSLKWVIKIGPQVLDLFDEVDTEYSRLCARAESVDRWESRSEIEKLERAFSRFLKEQDAIGIVPHGTHKIIRNGAKTGYDVAKRILSGNFTPESRRSAIEWLSLPSTTSDTEIRVLARRHLKTASSWSETWPFSANQLACRIGISIHSMKQFTEGGKFHDLTVYERIKDFLDANGSQSISSELNVSTTPEYRSDRGIKKKLKTFIDQHPLNKAKGYGPWPLAWNVTSSSRTGPISLYQALRFCIPAAALVVLGVFQARRESELTSITTSCIERDSDELWMETHIAKTLRHDKKLPTVDVSSIAVDLLTRWSKRGRAKNGSDLLFSYWEPLGKPIVTVKPNVDLNHFARVALDAPQSQRIQVRQFRRFFAITYMWRYRLGSLPALSEFLCHSGIAMTWEYVTERVGTSVMLEAQSEFSREILVSAAIGKTKLHGPFGRLWHRWVDKVRANIMSSVSFANNSDQSDKLFETRIEDGIRMLVPTPGGFCSAGDRPRDVKRAKCSTPDPSNPDQQIKNPELSRPGLCATCPFAATDNTHKEYWESVAQEARSAASAAEPSLLRERARLDAKHLERIAKSFVTQDST